MLYLDKNGITEYLGNYDFYAERSKEKSSAVTAVKQGTAEKPKVNEYKLRKEQQSNLRKLKTKIRRCEEEMDSLDSSIEQVQQQISDPAAASDFDKLLELTSTLEKYQQRQSEICDEWEQLQLQAEEAESQMFCVCFTL